MKQITIKQNHLSRWLMEAAELSKDDMPDIVGDITIISAWACLEFGEVLDVVEVASEKG